MARLLEQVRAAVHTRHSSLRTEEAYLRWAREYILFCGKRYPSEPGAREVSAFISHLAVERKVAASTQTQREEAWLMASLLYGSGLRLMECVRLRVKDVDLARLAITVRDGKGGKDRVTVLPTSLVEPLEGS